MATTDSLLDSHNMWIFYSGPCNYTYSASMIFIGLFLINTSSKQLYRIDLLLHCGDRNLPLSNYNTQKLNCTLDRYFYHDLESFARKWSFCNIRILSFPFQVSPIVPNNCFLVLEIVLCLIDSETPSVWSSIPIRISRTLGYLFKSVIPQRN